MDPMQVDYFEDFLVPNPISPLESSPPPLTYEFNEQYSLSMNSSDNNSSIYVNGTEGGMMEFSLPFQIVVYILYNVVFVSAVVGNVLVIYVVGSSARMRTVTNYLIANLALGDLLMALLCVPFSYISVLLQYWPFGRFLCHLVSPAQATCVFVSAYTLVALAIDRYMAILYPLRPRLRRSQALVVIGVVWLVALITAVPIALFTRLQIDPDRGLPLCEESAWSDDTLKLWYSLALMILQYFFPISVLCFTYVRIALAVWGKKAPGEAEDARDARLAKAKRKTILMAIIVNLGYTFAWLPLNLFVLYLEALSLNDPLRPDDPVVPLLPHLEYVFFACHWLAMAHTTYNPIIYAWINIKFRSAFIQVWKSCRRPNKWWLQNGSASGHCKSKQGTMVTNTTLTRRSSQLGCSEKAKMIAKRERGSSSVINNNVVGKNTDFDIAQLL